MSLGAEGVPDQADQLADELAWIQTQNEHLAKLFVAAQCLHAGLSREEVLAALKEIVANLIGCEEMALYRVEPNGDGLSRIDSLGAPFAPSQIEFGAGLVGSAAADARALVVDGKAQTPSDDYQDRVSACVPLMVGERASFVMVLFELLSQKDGFDLVDQDLIDLLRRQAGMALYRAELHENATTSGPVQHTGG